MGVEKSSFEACSADEKEVCNEHDETNQMGGGRSAFWPSWQRCSF